MLRIKPLLVLCAALLTVTPAASADVNSDMNQFFNKLGFASNTTQPGVWQGQAAGYAYGGSLYARTQVKNIQLISMTLPEPPAMPMIRLFMFQKPPRADCCRKNPQSRV